MENDIPAIAIANDSKNMKIEINNVIN